MPIPPTDREIIGMFILLGIMLVILFFRVHKAVKEKRRTVTWIRDWKEYP